MSFIAPQAETLAFECGHRDKKPKFKFQTNSLLLLSGPIASVLANKFGHRTVVILGGTLSGAGLLASAFADSVFFLYISYGIIAGELMKLSELRNKSGSQIKRARRFSEQTRI